MHLKCWVSLFLFSSALLSICSECTLAQRSDFGDVATNSTRVLPEDLPFHDGAGSIPDRATFEKLSYQGSEVLIDTHLAGQQFVKFQIEDANLDQPLLYFINTKTHRAHMMFMRAAGIQRGGRPGSGSMRGVLVYRPLLNSPNGTAGLYTFEFEPFDAYSFDAIKLAYDLLISKMPSLVGRLGYHPLPRAISIYESEQQQYEEAELPTYLPKDLFGDIGYLPLNLAQGFGRLRSVRLEEQPNSRDVVIYDALPNEMPRVAGIITSVRQTPLSHVNLRAIQDQVPNAFIDEPLRKPEIRNLLGKWVCYRVAKNGYQIREATELEVERHFAALRPRQEQSPPRDLSIRKITNLDELDFAQADSFGVKAANVATLRKLGFPAGTIPDGYAVPFYFYDQFMKFNGFYDYARMLLANNEFKSSREVQERELKKFRSLIKKGKMPSWMMNQLDALHQTFPAGKSVRCRSSTNNEDLPGFSGAGLYDSYTHHADEGHFSKSIKQVYASMWNYRAFEEREFYRINHYAAAMGVLVHRNFSGEKVNGVAVTRDVLYQTTNNFYINAQIGEDLVTNPEVDSIPEELLLSSVRALDFKVMRYSNRVGYENRILSAPQLEQLSAYLEVIHREFARLYSPADPMSFAMEIEFKITKHGELAIKQARPWVQ